MKKDNSLLPMVWKSNKSKVVPLLKAKFWSKKIQNKKKYRRDQKRIHFKVWKLYVYLNMEM